MLLENKNAVICAPAARSHAPVRARGPSCFSPGDTGRRSKLLPSCLIQNGSASETVIHDRDSIHAEGVDATLTARLEFLRTRRNVGHTGDPHCACHGGHHGWSARVRGECRWSSVALDPVREWIVAALR